eukprot:3493441-Rhodomonas_salina.1
MPHLCAIAAAVLTLSPVTCRNRNPTAQPAPAVCERQLIRERRGGGGEPGKGRRGGGGGREGRRR